MTYEHTQAGELEQIISRLTPPPKEHDREVMLESHPIHALPDVPAMITSGREKAKRLSRIDDLIAVGEFIKTASPVERRHIINMLIERGSEVDGCATELEDACCAIKLEDEEQDGGCDGSDWKRCWCEKCQDKRADYADYQYEQMKDRRMGL